VWESDLARELTCSVDVNTGVLVIEPGSLINFQGARGLRIDRGALEAEGAVFAGIEPGSLPGFWAGITFGENSSGYVRHSTLFASGGSHGAIETSSGQANVLYDTFLRMSRTALSVRGRTRDANVEGNLFGDIPGTNGATITVTDPDASPTIRYNQITGVDTGVSVRDGLPNINFNTFRSVRNNGITSSNSSRPCVNGRQNWWGAPSGPYDVKDEGRQNCGPQINEHGEGIPVGSNVNYDEWLTTPPPDAPLVDLPQCGVTNQTQQQVAGTTSSGARVLVFDGDNMAKELTADGAGRFASTIDLGPGQHRLSFEARGASDDLRSPRSGFRLVDVDPTLPVDPAGIRFEYGPVGSRRLQPIRDEAGCSTGCGGPSSGRVTLPPEGDCTPGSTCRSVAVIVHVPVTGSPSSVEFLQDGADPVALHQSGDEWVSGEFRPIQGPFRIGVNGADATECLGYVYPGGGGFVFADSGSPGDPIFFEDFENGMTRWSTDKWGIADRGHNSAHSATDSPDGTYMNEEDNSLYVPGVFDLRNVSAPVISFFEQHRLVRGDSARVEVRINNGSWRRLMTIEGTSGDWALQQISLDDYQRESKVELRFLLHSDRNGPNDDGWYVDDVSIGPGGAFNGRYDKDEPLVEDAEVTLLQRNPATGEWRTWDAGPTGQANPQRTDERGRFGFYNLPTGEYRIREDSRDYGPSQGAIVAVWNGTLDYQLPLAGSKPIYLPLMANSSRIN
jgi:hypothetical protein